MSWNWTPATFRKLEAFLRDLGLVSGSIETRRIGDGHSNLTYLVGDGERRVVVRRPPPPPAPPGSHDVLREARLIAALADSGVSVPTVHAVGQAGDVLDVPFYVMDFLDGEVITDRTPAALASAETRQAIAEALVDGLADLHQIDWQARGLEDFGRPEGFNRRHLRRIAGLVADSDGAIEPRFAELRDWLDAEAPAESGASIVHNDYRLGNVMWAPAPPARLLAILDWELATIGDPLLDVGYFVASMPEAGQPTTPIQDFAAALLEPGYPRRRALAERYAARSGRSLANLGWYAAMSQWKLAALYEYSRRRGEDRYYADPTHVERFLAAARRFALAGSLLE